MQRKQSWQANNDNRQSIVIVDDSPDNLHLLVGILSEQGHKVRPAPNGDRALQTIKKDLPALILLDIMMPDMDGYEVCRKLKANEHTKDIPIIFLSALNEVFDKIKAFRAGGVDYITKPFQVEEVLARVNTHLTLQAQRKALALQNEELKKKNVLITEQAKKLEQLALRDSLTGLANRRHFLAKAEQEVNRFHRTRQPFGLIMLDIDHFKKVNDSYGHECGDDVLTAVAQNLTSMLRAQDIVARWGGEEFVCLLPETSLEGARNAAEKIRAGVQSFTCECSGENLQVTVTLGVTAFEGSCSLNGCMRKADDALYQGKKRGRNRVEVASR